MSFEVRRVNPAGQGEPAAERLATQRGEVIRTRTV
jgi:hypothetical protein